MPHRVVSASGGATLERVVRSGTFARRLGRRSPAYAVNAPSPVSSGRKIRARGVAVSGSPRSRARRRGQVGPGAVVISGGLRCSSTPVNCIARFKSVVPLNDNGILRDESRQLAWRDRGARGSASKRVLVVGAGGAVMVAGKTVRHRAWIQPRHSQECVAGRDIRPLLVVLSASVGGLALRGSTRHLREPDRAGSSARAPGVLKPSARTSTRIRLDRRHAQRRAR